MKIMMNKLKQQQIILKLSDLRALSDKSISAFSIALDEQSELLVCDHIIRLLPGKRVVVSGTWKNQAVVAKLFFSNRGLKKDAQQDAQGIQAMQQAKILAPSILFQGSAAKNKIQVLIYQRISPALDFYKTWCREHNENVKFGLLAKLTITIARQHRVGLLQTDMYPDNYLISDDEIYALDGAGIKYYRHALKQAKSLSNLARLYAQFNPFCSDLFKNLLKVYLQSRGWEFTEKTAANFIKSISQERRRRQKILINKSMRNCTEYVCERRFKSYLSCYRDYYTTEMKKFLQNPELMLKAYKAKAIKLGNTCTVFKLKINGYDFILKRYNLKNKLHALNRAFRPSRASCYWRNGKLLSLLGIEAAKPIALLEKRLGPLRGRAYLLLEFVEGAAANQYFQQQTLDPATTSKNLQHLKNLISLLLQEKISHGDMKADNIIFTKTGACLLDLDSMQRHRFHLRFQRQWQRDMKRLLKNWQQQPQVQALVKKCVEVV